MHQVECNLLPPLPQNEWIHSFQNQVSPNLIDQVRE